VGSLFLIKGIVAHVGIFVRSDLLSQSVSSTSKNQESKESKTNYQSSDGTSGQTNNDSNGDTTDIIFIARTGWIFTFAKWLIVRIS